jgi:hypothetical protein
LEFGLEILCDCQFAINVYVFIQATSGTWKDRKLQKSTKVKQTSVGRLDGELEITLSELLLFSSPVF